ncbi:MAG TPA: helix-turn-helix domain-containing protein [Candidatus Deferrimicrobium sp.]|nr:helix-turn-helix domain-containing protein [Candidatus Deferrimicrobium sp.]
MNRKDLLKEIGYKLKKLRGNLGFSGPYMASRLGIARSSFLRNENGHTCPDILTLSTLGNVLDVSLDWLVCDKGPMYYREKVNEPGNNAKEILNSVPEDMRELIDYMQRIPLLRYKMLASFHEFKAQYKEMVSQPAVK